jgi:hypothetical protein
LMNRFDVIIESIETIRFSTQTRSNNVRCYHLFPSPQHRRSIRPSGYVEISNAS